MPPIIPTPKNCTAGLPLWIRTSPSPRSIAPSNCSRTPGYLERHDFRDGRSRYEEAPESHHDHLIDIQSGSVIEFRNEDIEKLQRRVAEELGFELVDHRLELYGVPKGSKKPR